ncbi:hypothetical protein [Roseiflexus sp.]|uniref:hypothetical protein n=1 Tax=Roseiflexus sp. TaxID=2562120 RepID=UPI00398A672B
MKDPLRRSLEHAVYGRLAGAHYGLDGIPFEWRTTEVLDISAVEWFRWTPTHGALLPSGITCADTMPAYPVAVQRAMGT